MARRRAAKKSKKSPKSAETDRHDHGKGSAAPAEAPAPRLSRPIIAAALTVAAVAVIAMAPGIPGELLNWDDDRFIASNDLITGFEISNIRRIFAEPHFEAYHPFHLVSYMVDYELWGRWAPGYKLHNLVLYLICLALLFRLLRRLGLSPFGAWAATLLFAAHPLHVEAVVWATARKETLSLAFMLGAALAALESKKPTDRAAIVALLLFAGAILTKTSTVVLPALLILADRFVNQRSWRESLQRALPMGLVACAVAGYVISLWQENEMTRPTPEQGLLGQVALVGKSYWHYLAKTIWPLRLSPVYPIDRVGAVELTTALGFAAIALVAVASWRSRDRSFRLFGFWFLVALIPVSNIVPVYFFVQDRYAFIATVGAAAVAGRILDLLAEKRGRTPALAASIALAAALVAGSALQARHWRSSLELWQHAAEIQPDSYYAHLALGHTLRDDGELSAAIDAYRRAVELAPELPFARVSLCLADARRNAARQERPAGEVEQLGAALRQRWGSSSALLDLSTRLLVHGYHGCAQLAESRAYDLQAPAPELLVRSASRWTVVGRPELALRYLERARERAEALSRETPPPEQERLDDVDVTILEVEAQAFELLGRHEQARQKLRQSLERAPRPPQRLLAAAQQLLRRGRPELVLLYADVVPEADADAQWTALRELAEEARDANRDGRENQETDNE